MFLTFAVSPLTQCSPGCRRFDTHWRPELRHGPGSAACLNRRRHVRARRYHDTVRILSAQSMAPIAYRLRHRLPIRRCGSPRCVDFSISAGRVEGMPKTRAPEAITAGPPNPCETGMLHANRGMAGLERTPPSLFRIVVYCTSPLSRSLLRPESVCHAKKASQLV